MTVYEAIANTQDIITKYAGKIIGSAPVYVPNSAINASNQLITTSHGHQFLVKQSDPWYLAGKTTHFFDGPGITINANLYEKAILAKGLPFIFITKGDAVYVCHFGTLQKYSYKVTQPDGEVVQVISWRKFTRWQ